MNEQTMAYLGATYEFVAIWSAGGRAEYNAVAELLSQLDSHQWTVVTTKILNRPLAPVLFIAARKC